MTSLQDLIDQISSAWPTPIDLDAIKQEERARLAAALVAAGYGAHATHTGIYLPAWIRAGCPPTPLPAQPLREAFEGIPWLLMVRIPAGRFLMGSPPEEAGRDSDEGPWHEVTLEAFWLGETPITQAQWREVAGWPKVERDLAPDPSRFKGDDRPVEQVNWHEAIEFCRRLSARTGKNYTLPSEAQWEYACRAGTTTPFHFGDTISTELANYGGRQGYGDGPAGKYREQTTDVASFPANPWGLHDMHGNVWEWCLDDWHDNYEGTPQDGSAWAAGEERLGKSCAAAPGSTGPAAAARPPGAATSPATATASLGSASAAADQRKVKRGGSWFNEPINCRSAYRSSYPPGSRSHGIGFRVCLTSNPAPAASQEAMAQAREESQAAAWGGMEPEQVLPAVESLAAAIEPTPHRNPQGFDVKRLADRLDELAGYVTQGPDCVRRNFTMRIPAEPYHDADLVLSAAASLLRAWLATPEAAAIEPTPPPTASVDLAQWLEDHVEHLHRMEAIGAMPQGELTPMLADAATLLRQHEADLAATREALRRLVTWGGFAQFHATGARGFDCQTVCDVAVWFADGMTGPLLPLPPHIARSEGVEPTPSVPALPPATTYDGGNGVVIYAANRERTSWVVQDDPIDSYLNSSGGWDYEPYLSSLSADSLARICWPSAEAAWAALLAHRAAKGVQS
jgi:formylglycine-generating enzyme required for sulfatase activity